MRQMRFSKNKSNVEWGPTRLLLMLAPGPKCQPSPRVAVDADICFEYFPHAGDLVNAFHMPLTEAAKTRQMSVTGFKALCRKRGIKRWPFRIFKSMNPKRSTSVVTAPCSNQTGGRVHFVHEWGPTRLLAHATGGRVHFVDSRRH